MGSKLKKLNKTMYCRHALAGFPLTGKAGSAFVLARARRARHSAFRLVRRGRAVRRETFGQFVGKGWFQCLQGDLSEKRISLCCISRQQGCASPRQGEIGNGVRIGLVKSGRAQRRCKSPVGYLPAGSVAFCEIGRSRIGYPEDLFSEASLPKFKRSVTPLNVAWQAGKPANETVGVPVENENVGSDPVKRKALEKLKKSFEYFN